MPAPGWWSRKTAWIACSSPRAWRTIRSRISRDLQPGRPWPQLGEGALYRCRPLGGGRGRQPGSRVHPRAPGGQSDLGFRAPCTPGGPGHNWVKARYIDAGPWVVVEEDSLDRVFIPARLADNPISDFARLAPRAALATTG